MRLNLLFSSMFIVCAVSVSAQEITENHDLAQFEGDASKGAYHLVKKMDVVTNKIEKVTLPNTANCPSVRLTTTMPEVSSGNADTSKRMDPRLVRLLPPEQMENIFLADPKMMEDVVMALRTDMIRKGAKRNLLGNMPKPLIKPNERELQNIIDAYQGVLQNQTNNVRTRALATFWESWVRNLFSDYYRSWGKDRAKEGKKAFVALKHAVELDPTFEQGWLELGDTLYDMSDLYNWVIKRMQKEMDLILYNEFPFAIDGLRKFNDDKANAVRAKLEKQQPGLPEPEQ